jgi:hypothetical protein
LSTNSSLGHSEEGSLEGADVAGIPGKVTVREYELRISCTLALHFDRHFGALIEASHGAMQLFGSIKRGRG